MTNPSSITIRDTGSTTTTGQSGQVIISGTPTSGSVAVYSIVQILSPGANSFLLNISGTWTGSLQIEASVDGGVTYVPYDMLVIGVGSTLAVATANGNFKGNVAGLTHIRVRATAAITGTATINLNLSSGQDVQHIELDSSGISIGAVAIDQTTPGTTNGVVVNNGVGGTFQKGQKVIAVTGTAVQLTASSYVLQNGIVITSKSTNNAAKGTVGTSSVTNTVDGTGNGYIIEPGASTGIPSGVNINTLYVNGTAGDVFSWEGN